MKKSELKSSIKEEIFNMLEDVEQTIKGTQAQKDVNWTRVESQPGA